jgi:hypothetical protein
LWSDKFESTFKEITDGYGLNFQMRDKPAIVYVSGKDIAEAYRDDVPIMRGNKGGTKELFHKLVDHGISSEQTVLRGLSLSIIEFSSNPIKYSRNQRSGVRYYDVRAQMKDDTYDVENFRSPLGDEKRFVQRKIHKVTGSAASEDTSKLSLILGTIDYPEGSREIGTGVTLALGERMDIHNVRVHIGDLAVLGR